MNKKRRCCVCWRMTYKWQRINQGSWHCFDGCYSTTGIDRRTYDAQPAWKQARSYNGRFSFGPWSCKRMKKGEHFR